jgi:hypothetical protein
MTEYSLICILEGSVKGDDVIKARRIVEDVISAAFETPIDSNPVMTRMKISVGGGSVTLNRKDTQ